MSAVRRELAEIRALLTLAGDVQTELRRHFERLEHKIRGRCCEHQCGSEPAHITLTASTSPEGPPMDTFKPGDTIYLTADVTNAEQAPVSDAVAWTATAADGSNVTVNTDPDNGEWANITSAPTGDLTVTATTSNGIASDPLTVTVADSTPAAVTVSASATPNTPAA